jgi:hypothetical protein
MIPRALYAEAWQPQQVHELRGFRTSVHVWTPNEASIGTATLMDVSPRAGSDMTTDPEVVLVNEASGPYG